MTTCVNDQVENKMKIFYFGDKEVKPDGITEFANNPSILTILYDHLKRKEERDFLKFKSIRCGNQFCLMTCNNDLLYGFGINCHGELLQKDNVKHVKKIKRIRNPNTGHQMVCTTVSAGSNHVVVNEKVNQEGILVTDSVYKLNLYGWGASFVGELGVGLSRETEVTAPKPIDIPLIVQNIDRDKLIFNDKKTLSKEFSQKLAVKSFFCGGRCTYLSIDDYLLGSGSKYKEFMSNIPLVKELMKDIQIKQISCGDNHTVMVDAKGEVYTWGSVEFGKLGHCDVHGNFSGNQKPLPTHEISNYKKNFIKDANSSTRNVLTETNYLYQPTQIKALQSLKINMVCAGKTFTLCLSKDGEIFSIGKIGERSYRANEMDYMNPMKVYAYSKECQKEPVYKKIVCGFHHAGAIDENGYVYFWGENIGGCLDIFQDKKGKPGPTLVEEFTKLRAIDIECGVAFTVCIMDNYQDFLKYTNYLRNKKVDMQKVRYKVLNGLEDINKNHEHEMKDTAKTVLTMYNNNQRRSLTKVERNAKKQLASIEKSNNFEYRLQTSPTIVDTEALIEKSKQNFIMGDHVTKERSQALTNRSLKFNRTIQMSQLHLQKDFCSPLIPKNKYNNLTTRNAESANKLNTIGNNIFASGANEANSKQFQLKNGKYMRFDTNQSSIDHFETSTARNVKTISNDYNTKIKLVRPSTSSGNFNLKTKNNIFEKNDKDFDNKSKISSITNKNLQTSTNLNSLDFGFKTKNKLSDPYNKDLLKSQLSKASEIPNKNKSLIKNTRLFTDQSNEELNFNPNKSLNKLKLNNYVSDINIQENPQSKSYKQENLQTQLSPNLFSPQSKASNSFNDNDQKKSKTSFTYQEEEISINKLDTHFGDKLSETNADLEDEMDLSESVKTERINYSAEERFNNFSQMSRGVFDDVPDDILKTYIYESIENFIIKSKVVILDSEFRIKSDKFTHVALRKALRTLCRSDKAFTEYFEKYLELKGLAYDEKIEFDEKFLKEVLCEIQEFHRKTGHIKNSDIHQRDLNKNDPKNLIVLRNKASKKNGKEEEKANDMKTNFNPNFVEEIKARLFASQKNTEELLNCRYKKQHFSIQCKVTHNGNHLDDLIPMINPEEEYKKAFSHKQAQSDNKILNIKKTKIKTLRERNQKDNSRILKVQNKKKKQYNLKQNYIVNTYAEKNKRVHDKDYLAPHIIYERQGNWQKEWIKFMELYKVIKRQSIVASKNKELKFQKIFYIQSVRKIQKRYLKHRIAKKIKGIPFYTMFWLLKMIKICKKVYKEHVKQIKVKKICSQFMIFNFKSKFRLKVSTVMSKIKEIQKFAHWCFKIHAMRVRKCVYLWDLNVIELISKKSELNEDSDIKRFERNIKHWLNQANNNKLDGGSKNNDDFHDKNLCSVVKSTINEQEKTDFQKHYIKIMNTIKYSKFEQVLEQLKLGGGSMINNAQKELDKMESSTQGIKVLKIHKYDKDLNSNKDDKKQTSTGESTTKGGSMTKRGSQTMRTLVTSQSVVEVNNFQAIKNVRQDIENNSLLPYSKSRNIAKLPAQYNFPIDNIHTFNKTIHIVAKRESNEKIKKINELILIVFKNYQKRLRQWTVDIELFVLENMEKINVERAKFMLNTSPYLLDKYIKKENNLAVKFIPDERTTELLMPYQVYFYELLDKKLRENNIKPPAMSNLVELEGIIRILVSLDNNDSLNIRKLYEDDGMPLNEFFTKLGKTYSDLQNNNGNWSFLMQDKFQKYMHEIFGWPCVCNEHDLYMISFSRNYSHFSGKIDQECYFCSNQERKQEIQPLISDNQSAQQASRYSKNKITKTLSLLESKGENWAHKVNQTKVLQSMIELLKMEPLTYKKIMNGYFNDENLPFEEKQRVLLKVTNTGFQYADFSTNKNTEQVWKKYVYQAVNEDGNSELGDSVYFNKPSHGPSGPSKFNKTLNQDKNKETESEFVGKIEFGKDHLPLSTLIQKIAKKLPGAPKKPKIEITIDNKDFKRTFGEYFTKMRDTTKEIIHKSKNRDVINPD